MKRLYDIARPWAALALFSLSLETSLAGTIFLAEDFNSLASDSDVTAAGWSMTDTVAAVENSTWTITNPAGRVNPAGLNGQPTTGNFLISDSDFGGAGGSNTVDTVASHDVRTPIFSTTGATGNVWLHMDTTAILNNDGAAMLAIDVSTDGGSSWNSAFRRISPGRFVDEGAFTFIPTILNTDGYFGRLDVDLGDIGGEDNVAVRVRHYEPTFDWWIAIDNVQIDDMGPRTGNEIIFQESFDDFTLGQMTAAGPNAGTESGWRTSAPSDALGIDRYKPGIVQGRGVNRINQAADEQADGSVQFAFLESDADPDPDQDEWLMTPTLDLSAMVEVFLGWEDEVVVLGDAIEVLAMQDANGNGPDPDDVMLGTIFGYQTNELGDGAGEDPAYAARNMDVTSLVAGRSDVFFAWRFAGSNEWWWAVDSISVSGVRVPEPASLGMMILFMLAGLAMKLRQKWG